MVFSERDWSATAKDGGEKRREAKFGDSEHASEPDHCHVSCGHMPVNLASWHTDREGTQEARPRSHKISGRIRGISASVSWLESCPCVPEAQEIHPSSACI